MKHVAIILPVLLSGCLATPRTSVMLGPDPLITGLQRVNEVNQLCEKTHGKTVRSVNCQQQYFEKEVLPYMDDETASNIRLVFAERKQNALLVQKGKISREEADIRNDRFMAELDRQTIVEEKRRRAFTIANMQQAAMSQRQIDLMEDQMAMQQIQANNARQAEMFESMRLKPNRQHTRTNCTSFGNQVNCTSY